MTVELNRSRGGWPARRPTARFALLNRVLALHGNEAKPVERGISPAHRRVVMTPLRQRMLDAMLQRGFASGTQTVYVNAIAQMARYYWRDPAGYSAAEVQAYLLHMVKDQHLTYSTMNVTASAARFLYETVLDRSRELFHIPMAKVPAIQPDLFSREEIARLFAACASPVHRMLLQTMYASGLRVFEACALRMKDIDSGVVQSWVTHDAGMVAVERYCCPLI